MEHSSQLCILFSQILLTLILLIIVCWLLASTLMSGWIETITFLYPLSISGSIARNPWIKNPSCNKTSLIVQVCCYCETVSIRSKIKWLKRCSCKFLDKKTNNFYFVTLKRKLATYLSMWVWIAVHCWCL